MLSTYTLQRVLEHRGFYNGSIDGQNGPMTKAALKQAVHDFGLICMDHARDVGIVQLHLKMLNIDPGPVDGIMGRKTANALNIWFQRNIQRGVMPLEAEVPEWYGEKGRNQRLIPLPYKMRLAWQPEITVTRMQCHSYVAPAMESIFYNVRKHYGVKRIQELKLDVFGGCLNVRKKRGGDDWSMHSWGIAVDIDPANNQLYEFGDTAHLARSEYEAFWRIVEEHGAVSYGRERDQDWQHFQFALFK